MLSTKLKEAAGNSADATLYVDDVFSTWLYTGNGSTQTITNGIDLAGKGGLVWFKDRTNTYNNVLQDTSVGLPYGMFSNTTAAATSLPTFITSYNSNGFSIGAGAAANNTGDNIVSWTFRKAAKFFDVVTWTGTGSARTIAHSLGVAPGMVIVKRTDTTGNWQVYSNGLTSAAYSVQLNLDAAQASAPTVWNSTAPTSSVFSVGTDATVNASGGTYVAYLFAHDTSSTGIIQCGSYNGVAGDGTATISLGWEPQYVLMKRIDSATAGEWILIDTMRGFTAPTTFEKYLMANYAVPEASGGYWSGNLNSTGFTMGTYTAAKYIYMAIRMPNKPPTTGTQVYLPKTRTGTGAADTVTGIGFAPDMLISENKASAEGWMANRLAGFSNTTARYLFTPYTSAESSVTSASSGVMLDGNTTGTVSLTAGSNLNSSGQLYVEWFFKRAPGFFDVVCVTTSGYAVTANHNLGVVPELIIGKDRNGVGAWIVWNKDVAAVNSQYTLKLNSNAAQANNGMPINTVTSTTFYAAIAGASVVNQVFYLFATLAGISKVGSYTGNGTGQTIACGFGSGGARFVLIKRTDSTGDWYTFDSARGLTSGSSPYLLLNSTAAEVTGNNGVYASSGGFTLGATAITTTNIATATYIFLAVA